MYEGRVSQKSNLSDPWALQLQDIQEIKLLSGYFFSWTPMSQRPYFSTLTVAHLLQQLEL
jgi:hypothetical protein